MPDSAAMSSATFELARELISRAPSLIVSDPPEITSQIVFPGSNEARL